MEALINLPRHNKNSQANRPFRIKTMDGCYDMEYKIVSKICSSGMKEYEGS